MSSRIDGKEPLAKPLTTDVFGSANPLFRKEPGEYMTARQQTLWREKYEALAARLHEGHFRQSSEVALSLRRKYQTTVFGNVYVYDLLQRLSECIDPTDTELYCVSQLVHTLQVAEGLEEDGVVDETLLLAALVHDLGKVVDLLGEDPQYTNGPNAPIGENRRGCGLDNATITWSHDEFAYQKLKDHVPDHVAWLIRFHSLRFDTAHDLMDDRDRRYYSTYLGRFRKQDLRTKSIFRRPRRRLSDYRNLIQKYFPARIAI